MSSTLSGSFGYLVAEAKRARPADFTSAGRVDSRSMVISDLRIEVFSDRCRYYINAIAISQDC